MNPFLRKKSIEQLQQESVKNTGLQRVLGLWHLTAIGLGGIIGVGIFVLTRVAVAEHAGPAMLLSFIITGILSVLFSFMLAASRIWFSMSRDGLLLKWFAKLHTSYQTPYRPTLIIGGITALVSGFTPIHEVAELVNIGTLAAFILICSSIIVLRKKRPDLERRFRTPCVPLIPLIGFGFSIYLNKLACNYMDSFWNLDDCRICSLSIIW